MQTIDFVTNEFINELKDELNPGTTAMHRRNREGFAREVARYVKMLYSNHKVEIPTEFPEFTEALCKALNELGYAIVTDRSDPLKLWLMMPIPNQYEKGLYD